MQQKKQFETFLTQNLNAAQQEAVANDSGPLLVVAGAGSGKTRVITARIAHLILNKNVYSQNIVALTFTNKAAQEMRDRVAYFLGSEKDVPFIGTFHSYCLFLLKKNADLLDAPFFSILDEDDQQKMVAGILARNNLTKKVNVKQVLYRISGIKNKLINPGDAHAQYANDALFAKLYEAYESERRASKCLDFDDLLLEGLKLFKNKEFKENFQEEVRHILVDEYQDTNVVQHELLKSMAKNGAKFAIDSICVVGDEDQSIYSWRGATVANIMNFKKDFPKTATIKIEQNYRSVQPILDIANHVISHNVQRNPKELWSEREASNRIYRINCLSEYHEGDMIASFLHVVAKKYPEHSTAILYRTHFQSRALEEALIKNSIPYKIIGGIQFYERKEIKDILAYVRLMINPFDRPSFFRVINCPLRGLGDKFEELFYERWHQEPFLTFVDLSTKLLDEGIIARSKKTGLISFIKIFDNITHLRKPSETIEHILTATGYLGYIKNSCDKEEAQERTDNIKELLNAVKHFESNGINSIEAFLNEVALMSDLQKKQQSDDRNPVLMMTLHAAKGLEFDTVIIPGLEEGMLPSSRSQFEDDKLEEERRLFYVGITRAKERLLFSRCRYRYAYGQMTDQLESRFLDEVPKAQVPVQDLSHAKSPQAQQFFSQWLGVTPTTVQSVIKTFGSFISKNTERVKKPEEKPAATSASWKPNQPVKHKSFGTGIVQHVEKKGPDSYVLEIKFKSGVKKVTSNFIEKI